MIYQETPKLRFPEFNGNWKKEKIGEISKTYSGGTPLTSNKKYYEGNIPFIKSGEINSEKTEQYINEEAINNSSAKIVNKGDLLLALYGATSGEVAISKLDGAINQAVLKIDNQMDNVFQYNYFLKEKKHIVHKYLQGGQGNLSAKIIKNLEFYYPNLDEQEKIATFLKTVDKKIELMKNKCHYYQDMKKYLMQQIFTKELKFQDNDDEWEWLNFEEIFKSVSTKKYQIKNAEINTTGTYEVIDQGQKDIAGYHNDESKLFKELPILIFGDHTTIVKYRNKPFIVGADGVKLLSSKINVDMKYMYYALNYFNIKPEGYKRHFSIIKKIDLPVPILKEQNQISSFFSAFDEKINFIQSQIEYMEEYKKGLLQKMFI